MRVRRQIYNSNADFAALSKSNRILYFVNTWRGHTSIYKISISNEAKRTHSMKSWWKSPSSCPQLFQFALQPVCTFALNILVLKLRLSVHPTRSDNRNLRR